jgi:uncharacterized membrane protein YeaQ/YmgE (transglycosylase-associated protein family)
MTITGVLAFIVFGFVIGLLARAVVPGKQGLGLGMTALLGIAGSLIGGLIASAVSGSGAGFRPSGFIGSLIGAIVLLLIAGYATRSRHRVA